MLKLRLPHFNICDLFVGLWILYYMQGLLYPQGVINQSAQLLMIALGLWSMAKCMMYKSTSRMITATILLVLMYTIYGGAIIMFGDGISWTSDSTYLKNSFNSLLPIFFFYTQSRRGKLSERRIMIYTWVMLFCAIVVFTYFGQNLVDELGVEEATNNMGYMFVALIPFVFFWSDKAMLQYILLAVIMLYILMGMKRGAIAIGAMAVAIFLYSQFKEGTVKRKIYVFLLSMLIVLGTIYTVGYMLDTSDYFAERVESTFEGDSSGRERLYSAVWNEVMNEQAFVPFLFGRGANSTIKIAGNFAHNDWLETACNNGLLGVCILLNFFIAFGVAVWRSRKYLSPHYYYCFFTLFAISLVKTMFSMSIQNFDMYQGMLIGYFAFWTSKQGRDRLMGQQTL